MPGVASLIQDSRVIAGQYPRGHIALEVNGEDGAECVNDEGSEEEQERHQQRNLKTRIYVSMLRSRDITKQNLKNLFL